MSNIIKQLEQEQMKQDVPSFRPGDTVEVKVWVVEGSKKRLQAFEGVVIAIRNRGLHSAFTVRKISNGEGVERVFQTHSPVEDAGFQSDCVADQRNDRRNNSHAPPAAVFLQQTGNNQRKTDGVGDKREQSKNGHSDVDSLSNKKEKQYSVR